MAYLIFTTLKGRELARRTLRQTLVIGRAPECDVCVHDILLSRTHCRFEPENKGWMLTDLASKNGTYLTDPDIGDREVGRHLLRDGDTVRLGKTIVKFHAGVLDRSTRGGRAYNRPNKGRCRPADPWSAMADTMSGFDYAKVVAEQHKGRIGGRAPVAGGMPVMPDVSRLPTPQPTPRDPTAYEAEDIYSLLSELASSSWDSIYMNASRPAPTREGPRPMVNGRHPRYRQASPVDMSIPAKTGPGLLAAAAPASGATSTSKRRPRLRRALLGMARGFATVGQSVIVLGIVHLLSKI
ncbi:MAG TPA: FHA domain-containing protein [Tepidisphaeraceae bacterium]|jgi:pSer/pThr/pTyr-binding forkhead associated (FHA) protein|nr:FHA domain-containing protein [Tepidisphaeraceae bacterium]